MVFTFIKRRLKCITISKFVISLSEKKNVKDEQLPDGLNNLVNQLR